MSQLDLPERCLRPIEAQTGDGSDYYTLCSRPAGHAHGCMSAAVDDRKRAAKEASKNGEGKSNA